MSGLTTIYEPVVIEGEVLSAVTVSPEQMARMNHARAVFRELHSILMFQIIPSLNGGWNNPLATEIERRLEDITFDSSNFLWKNRHAGAAHDAVHVGGKE